MLTEKAPNMTYCSNNEARILSPGLCVCDGFFVPFDQTLTFYGITYLICNNRYLTSTNIDSDISSSILLRVFLLYFLYQIHTQKYSKMHFRKSTNFRITVDVMSITKKRMILTLIIIMRYC